MNSDTDRMMGMITGYWVTQIVHAAATFSFAHHLAKGGATAEEIARAEGTDPSATFRLLRSCASLGMVTYDGKSWVDVTETKELLAVLLLVVRASESEARKCPPTGTL